MSGVSSRVSSLSSFRKGPPSVAVALVPRTKKDRLKLVLIEGAQLDTLAVESAVNQSLDIKRKLRLTFRTFGIVIPIWRMPLKLPAPAVAKTITEVPNALAGTRLQPAAIGGAAALPPHNPTHWPAAN